MIWHGICLMRELMTEVLGRDQATRQMTARVDVAVTVPWRGVWWLTMALISGADVSMPAFELQDDSCNIHRDIN